MTPLVMPIINSEANNGIIQCTDIPKKIRARLKQPNTTRKNGE